MIDLVETYIRAHEAGIDLWVDRAGVIQVAVPCGRSVPAWLRAAKDADEFAFVLVVSLGAALIRGGGDPSVLRTITAIEIREMS